MFLGQVRATPGTGTVILGSHSICLSSHRAWQDLRPWKNKHLFMGVWQGCALQRACGMGGITGAILEKYSLSFYCANTTANALC